MFEIPNKADAAFARQAGLYKADIDVLAAALALDGVLSGCGVSAQGAPDMTVAVAAGLIRCQGWYAYVVAGNVAIAAADATLDRIDLIAADFNGAVSRVAGTAAARPVAPAVPANSVILAQVYVPAADTDIDANQIVDRRVLLPDWFDQADDFVGGTTGTGDVGSLGWGMTGATPGTLAFQSGTDKHPGVIRLATGGANGNNQRIHLGSAANSAMLLPSNLARLRMLVSIPTITSISVKLGLGVDLSDSAAASLGTAGAWVEFVPATSAKWRYNTRQASASTTNADTGADVAASTWYQFDIVRKQNGNVQFAKNGVLQFEHATNLPSTAGTVGALVHTLTGAARNLDLDFIGYNLAPLGNRWT